MLPTSETQLIIAGAGSVGLLLGNLAGTLGIPTILIDRKPAVEDNAKAIGISPVSLEILARLGLADQFAAAGRQVRQVEIHGDAGLLGKLDFSGIGSDFPFILALPQGRTEALLADNLRQFPHVTMLRSHEITGYAETGDGIELSTRELVTGLERAVRGRFAAACDGGKSLLRELAGISWSGHAYRDTFLMGDFTDGTAWGDEARLFFTRRGSVESFPLPDGLRRYVLSTPRFIPAGSSEYLRENVPLRSGGLDLVGQARHWESAFGVQRFMARRYWRGRLVLCGDAAHVMSPIVGQNMNTGFADAEHLASLLPSLLADSGPSKDLLTRYQKIRQRAARAAGDRAWLMMRLGTSSGVVWSFFRQAIVRLALAGPWKQALSRLFAMVSIPGANLTRGSNRHA